MCRPLGMQCHRNGCIFVPHTVGLCNFAERTFQLNQSNLKPSYSMVTKSRVIVKDDVAIIIYIHEGLCSNSGAHSAKMHR